MTPIPFFIQIVSSHPNPQHDIVKHLGSELFLGSAFPPNHKGVLFFLSRPGHG